MGGAKISATRLRDLAAQTASQAAASELAAYALAEDTFGDKHLNMLAASLAAASARLSRVAGQITEWLTTPEPATTQEDTDDKPDNPDPAGS